MVLGSKGTVWVARWWQLKYFFIFIPTWGRFPFWVIVFRWVETTNQFWFTGICLRWFFTDCTMGFITITSPFWGNISFTLFPSIEQANPSSGTVARKGLYSLLRISSCWWWLLLGWGGVDPSDLWFVGFLDDGREILKQIIGHIYIFVAC